MLATVLLGGGIVGTIYLLPKESRLIKTLVGLTPFFVGYIAATLPTYLNLIRDWRREAKQDKFKELELENENLKLKLELQRQEQQKTSDNDK